MAGGDGLLALSHVWKIRPCARGRGNSAREERRPAAAGDRSVPPVRPSTQPRLLEGELKFTHRTGRWGEDVLQMLDGVPKRIGLHARGRFLAAAQEAAQNVQPLPQAGQQVIPRLQRKGQADGLRRGADAGLGEQRRQQRPQDGGRERVTRQHRRQKQGKRAPATAALAAVGAEDPLAPNRLAGGVGRIVAVEQAVPVQRLRLTAAGTALLLERKSSCWSAGSSRTKRNLGGVMRPVGARSSCSRRGFCNGTL